MSTPGELLEALGREARARLGAARERGQNVRVFRGRNVEELIPQIEAALGSDALIVRRREGLTGGVLGFFQRAFVEIEAMPGGPRLDTYDDEEDEEAGPFIPDPPLPGAEQPPVQSALPTPPAQPAQASVPAAAAARSYEASAAPPLPPAPPVPPAPPMPPAPATVSYAQELRAHESGPSPYVTAHLAALARYAPPAPPPGLPPVAPPRASASVDFRELLSAPRPREPVAPPAVPVTAPAERRTVAPGSQGRARAGVERSLLRYGISAEFAGELIDGASAHTLPLAPRAGLAQAVRLTLAQRIPAAALLPPRGAAIVIVGPGGSGKTTLCATLLRAYRQSSTLPASYATLLRKAETGELRMILSPQIVKPALASSARALRALRRVRADGLGILDTPSLSPADRTGIRELARLLSVLEAERVVVALPATLGAAAADQLLEAFAPLGAHALAVTHADETDQIGVAVEAACRHGLAPEYVLERSRGDGWRVERVDPAELAARMLQ
jgi:flagellar biosynthesis GTPase FlhF